MRALAAGIAGLLAVPLVAISCSHSLGDDVTPVYNSSTGLYDHPINFIAGRVPPYKPQIGTKIDLVTHREPEAWHMRVELWWDIGIPGKWEQIGHGLQWNKPDLPPVGHVRLFEVDAGAGYGWICRPGRYATRWEIWGVTSSGHSERNVEWWPFKNWKSRDQSKWNFGKPPSRKDAWLVKTC